MTPKRSSVRPGAYVTCLDCGKEFAYNWKEMRMELEPKPAAIALPVVAASTQPRLTEGLSRLLRFGS